MGDTLCRVLGSQDIGIRWFDHERRCVRYLYEYEHGQRLQIADSTLPPDRWDALATNREPRYTRTAAEMLALGTLTRYSGTSHSADVGGRVTTAPA